MERKYTRPSVGIKIPAKVDQNKEKHSTEEQTFMVKSLDKIITTCLFMLFFGLPLFFTGLSFQGTSFEKQIYFYLI